MSYLDKDQRPILPNTDEDFGRFTNTPLSADIMSRFPKMPEDFVTNDSKYGAYFIIAEVLQDRGFPFEYRDATDLYGNPRLDDVGIHSASPEARRLFHRVASTAEIGLLSTVFEGWPDGVLKLDEIDRIDGWDEVTRLRLKATYWENNALRRRNDYLRGELQNPFFFDDPYTFDDPLIIEALEKSDTLFTSPDGTTYDSPTVGEIKVLVGQVVDRFLAPQTPTTPTG